RRWDLRQRAFGCQSERRSLERCSSRDKPTVRCGPQACPGGTEALIDSVLGLQVMSRHLTTTSHAIAPRPGELCGVSLPARREGRIAVAKSAAATDAFRYD